MTLRRAGCPLYRPNGTAFDLTCEGVAFTKCTFEGASGQTPSEHPKSDALRAAVGSFAEGDAHPVYDSAEVDRTLIRWMLSLTPGERLRHGQGTHRPRARRPASAEGSR